MLPFKGITKFMRWGAREDPVISNPPAAAAAAATDAGDLLHHQTPAVPQPRQRVTPEDPLPIEITITTREEEEDEDEVVFVEETVAIVVPVVVAHDVSIPVDAGVREDEEEEEVLLIEVETAVATMMPSSVEEEEAAELEIVAVAVTQEDCFEDACDLDTDNDDDVVVVQEEPTILPATINTTTATAIKQEPQFFIRPTYSPSVARTVQPIKRSELKRQLREKTPSLHMRTATAAAASRGRMLTMVKSENGQPTTAKSRSSRGARLLTLAHGSAPLPYISLAGMVKAEETFDFTGFVGGTTAATTTNTTTSNTTSAVDDAVVAVDPLEMESSPVGDDAIEEEEDLQQQHRDDDDDDDMPAAVVTAVAVEDPKMSPCMHEGVEIAVVVVSTATTTTTATALTAAAAIVDTVDAIPPSPSAPSRPTMTTLCNSPEVPTAAPAAATVVECITTTTNNNNSRRQNGHCSNKEELLRGTFKRGLRQFTPMPRLFSRLERDGDGEGDSAATSPSSSCSILPAGLSGRRKVLQSTTSPRRHHRGHEMMIKEEEMDGDDGAMSFPSTLTPPSLLAVRGTIQNGALAAAAAAAAAEEEAGRRVRFVGVAEEIEREENEEEEGDAELGNHHKAAVANIITRPPPPPPFRNSNNNSNSSSNGNGGGSTRSVTAHVNGCQPRFGIGAFVRFTGGSSGSGSTATVDGGNIGTTGNDAVTTSFDAPVDDSADLSAIPAPAVVIARRLQNCGGGAVGGGGSSALSRRACGHNSISIVTSPLQLTSPASSIPQLLREAFLNARLAENWQRGEAWARLDLCGIELRQGSGPGSHLKTVIQTLTGQRGESAVHAALEQLHIEWEHLRCVRQRYVSSPTDNTANATLATATVMAAPKSILKHSSAVSPLLVPNPFEEKLLQERTPPSFAGGEDFDSILAAEVVPGSRSPQNQPWVDFAPILGGGGCGGFDSTPGIAAAAAAAVTTTTRGIKMLASLHQNGTPVGGNGGGGEGASCLAQQQQQQQSEAIAAGINLSTRQHQSQPRHHHPQQQQQKGIINHAAGNGNGGDASRRPPVGRGGTRGHRLLQALQNAATGPAATGGDVPGDLVAGPMATTFITST